MMNTLKEFLVASFLVLSVAGSNSTLAGVNQSGVEVTINNTVSHLEAALKAVNANDLERAQEHIKAAKQSSKNIIGGSYEAKAQHGSRAITKARRHAKKGNTTDAAASLQKAVAVYKSLLRPLDTGSRGGLK